MCTKQAITTPFTVLCVICYNKPIKEMKGVEPPDMLIEALHRYPVFQTLPLDKQHALLTLARKFEESEHALYLSPRELATALKIGSPDTWALLLSLEPTKNYIKKEMADRTQIASRKAFQSLASSAASGSVQAAREINDLNGIFEKVDNNKIIVLHRVNRPKVVDKVEE